MVCDTGPSPTVYPRTSHITGRHVYHNAHAQVRPRAYPPPHPHASGCGRARECACSPCPGLWGRRCACAGVCGGARPRGCARGCTGTSTGTGRHTATATGTGRVLGAGHTVRRRSPGNGPSWTLGGKKIALRRGRGVTRKPIFPTPPPPPWPP